MIYYGISTVLHLYVHFNDGLADEGSTKEGPEGNEEMTTCDPCQVKQWIGDLGRQYIDGRRQADQDWRWWWSGRC